MTDFIIFNQVLQFGNRCAMASKKNFCPRRPGTDIGSHPAGLKNIGANERNLHMGVNPGVNLFDKFFPRWKIQHCHGNAYVFGHQIESKTRIVGSWRVDPLFTCNLVIRVRPIAASGLAYQIDCIVLVIFDDTALPTGFSMPTAATVAATTIAAESAASATTAFLFGTGFIDCKITSFDCKTI